MKRFGPGIRAYFSSLCLASILLSKFIHLHFHYSYEAFVITDAVFLPSFFIYDVLTHLFVRLCLNPPMLEASTFNYKLGRWKDDWIAKEAPSTLFFNSSSLLYITKILVITFGVACTLAIALFSTTEFYIYIMLQGLCSWSTTLEVFSTPSYLLIFWEQWMTSSQMYFLLAIPLIILLLTVLVHLAQKLVRLGFHTCNLTRRQIVGLVCLGAAVAALDPIARPWNRIGLHIICGFAWTTIITGLLIQPKFSANLLRDKNFLPAPSYSQKGSNKRRTNLSRALNSALLAGGLLTLVSLRPQVYHDMSTTVPASVIFSIMGVTLETCPVGKSWPEIPIPVRQEAQTKLHHSDMTSLWGSDPPLAGFEMFSRQRMSEWAAFANGTFPPSSQPSGYHELFDKHKISNLNNQVLPQLLEDPAGEGELLSRLKIRNVVVILMESTPENVFPMRPGSLFYNRTTGSRISGKHYEDIEGLMPLAERLFDGKTTSSGKPAGISIKGAETSCSYTLKSLLASHCGLSPLPMDLMREAVPDAHLYQPCIPHILHALNTLRAMNEPASQNDQHQWKLLFGQSCDERWDRQMDVMEKIGFNLENEVIVKSTMAAADAPYPVPQYLRKSVKGELFFPERFLAPYFRDMIRESKANKGRFFISHLTCSTHYPWILPADWKMKDLSEDWEMNMILNSMMHQDEWLADLLNLMEAEGVLEDTLVVITGDHGTALREGDLKQSFQPQNPHISNFKVPLAFYHPQLPHITISTNATSLDILPTIIDMLLNSNSSLVPTERELLQKLLPSYEGQSLIRNLNFQVEPLGHSRPTKAMKFGLGNPGRGFVTAFSPDPAVPWRFMMPLCHPGTLTASNIIEDPGEDNPVRTVDLNRLLYNVRNRWGEEAADWFEEAAARATEWVREVSRRWGVNHRSPPGEYIMRGWKGE